MDKSNYKWVYPVPQSDEDSPHTQWVYEVDSPEPGVEQVWLVSPGFYEDYYKHVEWVLFVGPSRKDSPHSKKVFVAGYDPYYDQGFARMRSNLPRKLRRR